VIEVRALVRGIARGPVLLLEEALSFWGGIDPDTGTIIDNRHPQRGLCISGTVLAMPSGRGSSSSSSVLAEAIRLHTAPAAIILREADGILVLGSLVARELYGVTMPIAVARAGDFAGLRTGVVASIDAESVSLL
jgi:uncharacterized protein